MKRRTLLQMIAGAAAVLPFERIRLLAQPRELTPEAVTTLRTIAPTVLPSALGEKKLGEIVDRFTDWTKNYREGVPLAHGYGHPRLRKSGPSPTPLYLTQIRDLEAAASKAGGWAAMSLDARRAVLDEAFTKAGVRNLPVRPSGQHVVADLMAFYFRSSEANDYCYSALIAREVCRPIAITTKRPAPLA
jgi:hypothetical protein